MKTPPQKENKRPIWVLTGPTASGKSALAMAIAAEEGAEIVVADSVQAVMGFDIGSAKPSEEDQRRVRHHLVDVTSWDAPLDAQRWAHLAKRAIADIHGRGRPALLVGGTGLYLRALRDGLVSAPSDPALRSALAALEVSCPGSLYKLLQAEDPASALTLAPTNPAHLIRALEITRLCGEPASVIRARHAASMTPLPMRIVALARDDAYLRERIQARTEKMVALGLIEEVDALLRSNISATCQAMRAIGYRQTATALQHADVADLDLDQLKKAINDATWQYVRRQRTWMRREARQRSVEMVPLSKLSFAAECQRVTSKLLGA